MSHEKGRPGRPPRSEREPYDVDRLTDIALAVFRERGYEGTSIVDIARATGLTKSSLYHHVAGKEELLTRGLERAIAALVAVLDEPGSTVGEPIERLAYLIRRVVQVEMDMLPEVSVLLRARGNTESERRILDRRREFDRAVAALVTDAQVAGQATSEIDALLLSRLIFGMINWLTEWYRPDGSVTPDHVIRGIERLVFSGITVSADDGPPGG